MNEDTTTEGRQPVAGPMQRPVGRQVEQCSDEAVRLAHKMARAAGPQKARLMAQACYMLLCTAAMTDDPDAYFEWLEKQR